MPVQRRIKSERKKFSEHLFDFLMVFLAVTLGFFTENYREHLLDKEKEKQCIESLVQCLASDTVQLKDVIHSNMRTCGHLDSLLLLKNSDLSLVDNKKEFLIHSFIGFYEDWYFRTNDAALQQLKSSGMLRLIRKQEIIDSISDYELRNGAVVAQEADCYFVFKQDFLEYKNIVDLSFIEDTSIMVKHDGTGVQLKNIDKISISSDKEKIKNVFSNAASLANTEKAYMREMNEQLSYGKNLIIFLKREYRLR